MNPLKIRFAYDGTLKNNEKKETTYLINKIGIAAFDNRKNIGIAYTKYASNTVIPEKKLEIQEKLLADNTFFEFTGASFEPFEIKADPLMMGYQAEFTWEMKFRLLSDTYTCIEVLQDKTAIYYGEDKEIKFMPLHAMKMIVSE